MLQKKSEFLGYSNEEVAAPEHPNNQALAAYWDKQRAGAPALPRAALEPLDIPRLLPGIFLAEPCDDGAHDYRFRLAGSLVEERMRRKVTGKTLTELYGDKFGPQTIAIYDRIATTCTPLVLQGHFEGDNLEHIRFEVLHLPLEFANGARGILGGQFAFD